MRFGKYRVQIGVFPIGVDVDHFAAAAEKVNHKTRRLNRMRHDLHRRQRWWSALIASTTAKACRCASNPTRNSSRFIPEERKRVSFMQITPPTRSWKSESYRRIRAELASTAGDIINARFGSVDWMVLRYVNEKLCP